MALGEKWELNSGLMCRNNRRMNLNFIGIGGERLNHTQDIYLSTSKKQEDDQEAGFAVQGWYWRPARKAELPKVLFGPWGEGLAPSCSSFWQISCSFGLCRAGETRGIWATSMPVTASVGDASTPGCMEPLSQQPHHDGAWNPQGRQPFPAGGNQVSSMAVAWFWWGDLSQPSLWWGGAQELIPALSVHTAATPG